ncbi:tetratricopeptide repeat protein [Sporosarcina sp. CAU 1771]
MIRQNQKKQSNEERLEEITLLLNEEQQKTPLELTARIADLSRKMIRLKKVMGILTEEEQDQLVRSMMAYAFHMKTGEHKDRYAAKNTFEQILKIDPRNAEANYRYAFLYYEDRDWIQAINHFNKALGDDDSAFPLWDDQLIKAHLFIGYCSIELAKASMQVADELSEASEVETSTGISVEDLSVKLQEKLAGAEFVLYSNEDRRMISKSEREAITQNFDFEGLVLDFTGNKTFIQRKDKSCDISIFLAVLLKQLLLKSSVNEALSLTDIDGYQEESVANSNEVTWDNYRTKISRINKLLAQIGFPERFIQHVLNTNSYTFPNIKFYILARDGE